MPTMNETILRPASGGFGEWDWIESAEVVNEYGEVVESYSQYEALLDANGDEWEQTNELAGRIHNEYGQVYKIADGKQEGETLYKYAMVWSD